MALTRTAQFYVDRATITSEAEYFVNKARKAEALADLNTAFDYLRRDHSNATHAIAPEFPADGGFCEERRAHFDKYEVPFQLNHVRDRHVARVEALDLPRASMLRLLVELRAAIKDMPVAPPPPKAEPSPYEVKARETLMELMTRRKSQYLEAISLAEVFGGLPVSANTHFVTNEHGTTFLRTFYYLAGKFTPVSVIIAAAEELARREEAK